MASGEFLIDPTEYKLNLQRSGSCTPLTDRIIEPILAKVQACLHQHRADEANGRIPSLLSVDSLSESISSFSKDLEDICLVFEAAGPIGGAVNGADVWMGSSEEGMGVGAMPPIHNVNTGHFVANTGHIAPDTGNFTANAGHFVGNAGHFAGPPDPRYYAPPNSNSVEPARTKNFKFLTIVARDCIKMLITLKEVSAGDEKMAVPKMAGWALAIGQSLRLNGSEMGDNWGELRNRINTISEEIEAWFDPLVSSLNSLEELQDRIATVREETKDWFDPVVYSWDPLSSWDPLVFLSSP